MAAQPIPPRGQKAYPAPVQVPGVNIKETMSDVDMEAGDSAKKNVSLPRSAQNGGSVQKRLPKSTIKKRNNSKLKKLVAPKSPLMVLNEMVASESGGVVYSFPEAPKAALNMPAMYVAHAQHEGETFTGSGPSKLIAKNLCAEQIIQAIVTKKCVEKQAREAAGETTKLEDETPWTALASLAIYKLFNDWQMQGYAVPPELTTCSPQMEMISPWCPPRPPQLDFTTEAGAFHDFTQPGSFQQKPAKQMPANPTTKHPVQLLNELRGSTKYEETEVTGEMPNCVFTMTCDIDGTTYSGQGKSKKEAKKEAAMKALEAQYSINY